MKSKFLTYLGFAQKSRNLFTGENTCDLYLKKGMISLLIICEDASDNTKKKFVNLCETKNTPYIIYGSREDLSASIGKYNVTVYGIKDKKFSNEILKLFK